jgi:hypothetical protein
MAIVAEPLSREREAQLRRLVIEHHRDERRRRFAPVLHLGWPGRPEVGRVVEPVPERSGEADGLDHGLRCDLLAALVKRARDRDALAWLTRPGPLDLQDVDAGWLRAVASVSGEAGHDLGLVVVTRRGWRDPRSGVGREWRRLRVR